MITNRNVCLITLNIHMKRPSKQRARKAATMRLCRGSTAQHGQISQGACWYKQQVTPVWQCQTKPCCGPASVLWQQRRSRGVTAQCIWTAASVESRPAGENVSAARLSTSILGGGKLSGGYCYLKQNTFIWKAHRGSWTDLYCPDVCEQSLLL